MVVKIKKIHKKAFENMISHAEEGYPHEVCGVMIGKDETVEYCIRCNNLNTERAHDRYELDPKSYKEADEWARKKGLDIIGIYHSHPDHPSKPSQFDFDRAWPDWGYIIFSINNGKYSDARLWYVDEGSNQFVEQKYEIV